MAFMRILLWLGYALIAYACLMLLTAFCAVVMGEFAQANLFFIYAIIVGIFGTILYFIGQNAPTHEGAREALLFLLLFWLFIPVLTCLPYFSLPEISNLSQAYFEAASATTTTGASMLNPDDLPRTFLFWQAVLQWSSGCLIATFAVVILAVLNLNGIGEHRSALFILRKGEIFSRLLGIGKLIAFIYALIALFCFVLLVLARTPVFDALCLSLSAVSTGGLVPRSGALNTYVTGFGSLVLAMTCLLGAANISVLWDIVRRRNLAAILEAGKNIEHRGIFAMISLLIIVGFVATGVGHLHTIIVEAAFMASSTGFDYHVIGIDMVPSALLIALVLVGGSALSTAGGLKIIRMLLLFRHLRTDIDRMSHPSRVMPVTFQGRTIDDKAFLSIWMYFFAYTLVFALGIAALGASGLEFTQAVAASASALSNTGPLLAATNPEISYSDMSIEALNILSVIMLLGRIEVLAVFAVIMPSFWRY